mgnify:CR=1 FL=1|tara:strand:- start:634 stop:879 length:246 start_codon:yes stop_codon:yes gene_type:complete
MNDITVFLYGVFFFAVAGATFAFMWKSMTYTFETMNKPIKRTRSVHPEMDEVESGTELLVFRGYEEEDEDDGEGDILAIRK